MEENQEEPQAEQQKEMLTKEIVSNRIDYGQLIARFPDERRKQCRAYTIIQKIYRTDKSEVKGFYRCSRCKNILQVNVSNGTAPLTRHADEKCTALSAANRAESRAARLGYAKETADENVANDMVEPVDAEKQTEAAEPTSSFIIKINANDLALALSKATDIGFKYGRTDSASFAAILRENQNKW